MTEQKQTGTATSAEVAPTETASGRKLDRRNFLRTGSYAGLGLAGAAIAAADLGAFNGVKGADALHLGPAPVHAAGFTPTDIEVLQFALNLEYLDAEFYSYAGTGKSLEDNGVTVSDGIGKVGPTTGGYKVPFSQFNSSGPVKAVGVCFSERPAQSVRNGPGSTQVTLMPSGAVSVASASDQPSTACLLAA